MKAKKKLFLISVIIILVAGLSLSSCVSVRLNSVKGSGNITNQEVDVSGTEKLVFNGLGEVIIEQGDEAKLIIEAEDNLIQYIKADVSGNRLTIGFKRGIVNIVPTETPKFYLTVPDLEGVRLTGAGSIEAEGLSVDDLDIESSGLGSIEFNEIYTDDLSVSISGAGNITVSGEAEEQVINISGLGSYKARDLKSRYATIEISGAGKATVYASESLDIELTGLGSIEYLGNPAVTQKITGPGSVRSIE